MSISDEELARYQQWVGRETRDACVIAPESCDLMAATLDRDDAPFKPGDPLPVMWSAMGFRPHARRSRIGVDGHPERGDFLPPVALSRRMFAGARLRYLAPLPCGTGIERVQRIAAVTPKRGASGLIVLVTVAARWSVDGVARLEEEQDIVYRAPAEPGAAPEPQAAPVAPPQAPWSEVWTPDPVTLFRYSALTFNGHRIHYDRRYALDEEGYPGLVVHGPLTATLLADLCRRNVGRALVSRFSYRARKPLFDTGAITLTGAPGADGKTVELGAYDAHGALAMSATATFESAV